MKTTLMAGAALLALVISAPVQARTILPSTYAIRYCQLRDIGASRNDAIDAALRDSTISADEWVWVTINGKRYKSDTVEAVKAVSEMCPKYLTH